MMGALKNQPIGKAKELCKEFLFSIHHDKKGQKNREDFEAFAAAREFPGRIKCASLSWDEMSKFLEDR